MKYANYLFFVNHTSNVLIFIFFLVFFFFFFVKIIPLHTDSKSSLAKKSGILAFVSFTFTIISLSTKFYTEHLFAINTMQLLLQDKILVTINGEIAKDDFPHYFRKSIAYATQIKDKGSSPTKVNYVDVYMNEEILMRYIVRQDSRDPNMYWFSAALEKYHINLGFIKFNKTTLESFASE